MQLILMRHGEAEQTNGPDSARNLTERGRQQASHVGSLLAQSLSPDVWVSSNLARAQQTLAQVVTQLPATTLHSIQYESELLAPDAEPRAAIDWLYQLQQQHHSNCMLVVCHMNIIAFIDGLLRNDQPLSFGLAEARCYQQPIICAGLSQYVSSWLPSL